MPNKTLTTPVGIARYPHLNRPDTKYADKNKPDGEYKAVLEMSAEDAEPFIKQVESMFSEFVAAKKAEVRKDKLTIAPPPWEENDGMVQFKLKVYATWTDKEGEKKSRAPKLFAKDSSTATDNIGGGSKIQVAVEPYFWPAPGKPLGTKGCGIMLQPKAVMVHELVTWGSGASAESYGFDVSEAKPAARKTGTDDREESIEW
jgi:hypothetical protein